MAQVYRSKLRGIRPLEIKSLTEQVDNLEEELGRRSAEFRAQALPVTLESVQAAIPEEAALIEFASFRPYDAKTRKYRERRFVVYLLTHSGDIKWANLGEAAKIEKAVKAFRAVLHQQQNNQLASISREVKPKARALYELIMCPLRAFVGDKKTVVDLAGWFAELDSL